ncbi:hypothetical protein Cme02nite_54610 [Catellatospora methionotrophica]|uniref:DUF2264 domain-containing protein n=1 Tax=Catellatospora methionotrophica TaxID=121620 RepID=A0A8J3LEE2_9ACTN|nr:DUF2264 domain-containing protein [Catellatospora methionotrophica]GIG17129.1 hypothetical protein Cme02nite_54610 [Catellatospora methionotrophica]
MSSHRTAVDEQQASLSPYTGWTRTHWSALADHLLAAAWRHASPTGALITPPGPPGGYGTAVDGLEGFARTFLLAGFQITGEHGNDPANLLERYAAGLAAGTDPRSPERWTTPREHGQAKVEAASIALILDMTRPWLWDNLDHGVRDRVVDYLAQVVGDHAYPQTNWVWFRIVVEQFLASVGGPFSPDDMAADLATHESFARDGGWYCDGPERSYDHYAGWALHLYPILWSRMTGAQDRAAPLLPTYRQRLDRYLLDAVRLVGADGSPLIQGRSLTYRFAAAAPFWAGALAGSDALAPGLTRRAASGIVKHFTDRGAPDDDGLLNLGWFHPWRPIAQHYSGTGSPYWASKGLLGLALPAEHPVWTATEQPLPVEQADQFAVVAAPGWALSATAADGVVRVYNHGTDHARPGDRSTDSPLYARFGYSTATAPAMDDDGWHCPLDQSVVLLDTHGEATHRSGFTTLDVRALDGDAAVLASRARCHWVTPDPAALDYGSGLTGQAVDAATVTTVSVVRGAWEVRLIHVDPAAAPGWEQVTALRVGGWPVPAAPAEDRSSPIDAPAHPQPASPAAGPGLPVAEAVGTTLTSTAVGLYGLDVAGVHTVRDATPLAAHTAIPWLQTRPQTGWHAAAFALNGGDLAPLAQISGPEDAPVVRVTWPDQVTTTAALPAPPTGPHHHAQNRSSAA